MNKNVGSTDKVIRIVVGLAILVGGSRCSKAASAGSDSSGSFSS